MIFSVMVTILPGMTSNDIPYLFLNTLATATAAFPLKLLDAAFTTPSFFPTAKTFSQSTDSAAMDDTGTSMANAKMIAKQTVVNVFIVPLSFLFVSKLCAPKHQGIRIQFH